MDANYTGDEVEEGACLVLSEVALINSIVVIMIVFPFTVMVWT